MNRKIKFRAKGTLNDNIWYYGAYFEHMKRLPSPIGDCLKENDMEYLIISNGLADWNMPTPISITSINPNTVGQYIGINDKYGKEIYEDDIVICIYNGRKTLRKIVFDLEELDFKATNGKENYNNNVDYIKCCEEIEVVGNVYDNPELLKKII